MTRILIVVTVISKLIGFVREMMLLGTVGITAGLDLLTLFFSFSTFVAGVVGTCVVTNLTPIAARNDEERTTASILVEACVVGAALTLCLVVWNLAYIQVALSDHPEVGLAGQLSWLMAAILLFSIIAEYQVALFLARDNQVPVISGNILISLPLVLGMLFFDISILSYAIGLTCAFAFRVVIFAVLLRPNFPLSGSWWIAAVARRPIMTRSVGRILKGSSAMLAINLIFLVAMILAERQSVGAATLVGYGRKIPMLVLTSLWFVLGSRFFSQIVRDKGRGSRRRILELTRLNGSVMIALFGVVLLVGLVERQIGDSLSDVVQDFALVISASLPLLPIIVAIPIVEMAQRTLSTLQRHELVWPMSLVSLAAAVLTFGIVTLAWNTPQGVMAAISISIASAIIPALGALKKVGQEISDA